MGCINYFERYGKHFKPYKCSLMTLLNPYVFLKKNVNPILVCTTTKAYRVAAALLLSVLRLLLCSAAAEILIKQCACSRKKNSRKGYPGKKTPSPPTPACSPHRPPLLILVPRRILFSQIFPPFFPRDFAGKQGLGGRRLLILSS